MAYGFANLGNMQHPYAWRKLFDQLQQSGIAIDPTQTGGVGHRPNNPHSVHPRGRAADINSRDNPLGSQWKYEPAKPGSNPDDPYGMDQAQDRPGQTVLPAPLARWAAKENDMTWGGDFKHGRYANDAHHFQLNRDVPEAPMGAPLNIATGPQPQGASPITTGSVAQAPQAPLGGGIAPAAGGMGFLQNLAQNPLFLEGLMMLTQGTRYQPGSGAGIANSQHERILKQLQMQRQDRRDQVQDQHSDRSYGLQERQFGLSEQANKRAESDQRMQEENAARLIAEREHFRKLFSGGGAPAQAPAPAGPVVPLPGQVIDQPAAPQPAAAPAAPQAVAPQARMPAAEPMVTIGAQQFPIARAREIHMFAPAEMKPAIKDAIDAAEKEAAAARSEAEVPTTVKANAYKMDDAFQNLDALLNDYQKAVQKSGMVYANHSETDEVVNLRKKIQLKLKTLEELGALQKPDLPFIDLLPDPQLSFGLGTGSSEGYGTNLAPLTGQFLPWSEDIVTRTDKGVDALKKSILHQRNTAVRHIGMPPIAAPEKPEAPQKTPNDKMRGGWSIKRLD